MFILMVKQIYTIQSLSSLSDDFVTNEESNSKEKKDRQDKKEEENPTRMAITEKLRNSIIKRQKFFSPKEQLNLLRFLIQLDINVLKEKEWLDFTRKVLSSVPLETIMQMSLAELQSFTINFNMIRKK